MISRLILYALGLALLFSNDGEAVGRGRRRYFKSKNINDIDSYPTKWFTQQLDHFHPADNRTWLQRYWMRNDFHTEGGPVFLYIGGEVGESSDSLVGESTWVKLAKKYEALMLVLEHRFYGESHPTSNLSVENLKYLSSHQALEDLALFIVSMTQKHNLPKGTKWIAFGGSYPGNLATWLRYKFPHLVYGSVASSAPLLAQLDFSGYWNVVKNVINSYNHDCFKAIKSAFDEVQLLLQTEDGRKIIEKKFGLRQPIDSKNKDDVAALFERLFGIWESSVQYNSYRTLCTIMTDTSIGSPLDRLQVLEPVGFFGNQEEGIDSIFAEVVQDFKSSSWLRVRVEVLGDQAWMYQTCTEFGYYQTSEKKDDFLGNTLPLEYFTKQCTKDFGPNFTEEFIQKSVDHTNILYGGLDLEVTRVVSVHGTSDPWHVLGLNHTKNPQSPVILIPGTSHCTDMLPDEPDDSPALREAREEISSIVGCWLRSQEYCD